jgi:hypothetical protein
MTSNAAVEEESVIRETLAGLLEDFREHAQVVLEAQRQIESDAAGSAGEAGIDCFDSAVSKLDAALTALEVTVPAILGELDRLDEIPQDN